MKRRNFLKTATSFATPILLGGTKVAAITQSSLFPLLQRSEADDRVLVIIQLNGGNDGLNTFIPLDQYDRLMGVRENIMLPRNELLSMTDTMAMHPSMTGLKSVYEAGKIALVQSVGYPDQNRSHFRSKDIWMTGSEAGNFISTGWMGRYFDTKYSDYPEGYPSEEHPDPIAITIGALVSATCQGIGSNFSLALNDPFALSPLTESEGSDTPDNYYGKELAFLRTAIAQTNAYGETILNAAEKGNSISTLYPEAGVNPLADQLKIVANLISGGLQTKVYVVSLGGFDTHADQVAINNPLLGEHAILLQYLSEAIHAFQDDLQQLGLEQRVVGMTFSEFGRRIASNGSFGTDHGSAAPLLVFGSCVQSAIIGDNPEIPEEVGVKDGVQMQFDFRSVYGSLLMDWFGADELSVKSLLYDNFQYIPLIAGCDRTTSIQKIAAEQEPLFIQNYPNPFSTQTTISFDSKGEQIRLSIFNGSGSEIKVITNQYFPNGRHTIDLATHHLAAGNYYCRMQTERGITTCLMGKID